MNYPSFLFFSILLSVANGDEAPVGPPRHWLWPNAEVFYEVDPSIVGWVRENLQLAIEDFHRKTCIRWTPRSNETSYVGFYHPGTDGCAWSGLCWGPDRVVWTSVAWCRDPGTFIHEMGHVLCMGHEDGRADRDNYLKTSCTEGWEPGSNLNFGHLYDYESIMSYYYSKDCATIDGVQYIGRRDWLSVLDAEKINDFYNCGGCLAYRFRNASKLVDSDKPMVAGFQGDLDLYVCRGYAGGDIVVGKARLAWSVECYLPKDGKQVTLTDTRDFEILTNPTEVDAFRWEKGGEWDKIPSNAIAGGRTTYGETLYVARCITEYGNKHPGKVAASTPNKMSYAWGGDEYECTDFEVLVCYKYANNDLV